MATRHIPQAQRCTALLLAAGAGSRFAGPEHKLLVEFRGRPLCQWAIDAARSVNGAVVVVWAGAGEVPGWIIADPQLTVVMNERFAEGQATSLAAGLDHIADRLPDAEHVVVGLADQPMIPAGAWQLVANETSTPIAVATYDSVRRNPVRLHRSVWDLIPRTGDQGARPLLRSRPELVTAVACPGLPIDIDTREDLDRWNSITNS